VARRYGTLPCTVRALSWEDLIYCVRVALEAKSAEAEILIGYTAGKRPIFPAVILNT